CAALGERLLALVAGSGAPPPAPPWIEAPVFDQTGEVLSKTEHARGNLRHRARFVIAGASVARAGPRPHADATVVEHRHRGGPRLGRQIDAPFGHHAELAVHGLKSAVEGSHQAAEHLRRAWNRAAARFAGG